MPQPWSKCRFPFRAAALPKNGYFAVNRDDAPVSFF
jgi:hypothetical protein